MTVKNTEPNKLMGTNDAIPDDSNTAQDLEIEQAWVHEARRRLELYRKGEMKTKNAAEVLSCIGNGEKRSGNSL